MELEFTLRLPMESSVSLENARKTTKELLQFMETLGHLAVKAEVQQDLIFQELHKGFCIIIMFGKY